MNQAFAEIRECVKRASDRAVSYVDLHSLVQTSPQANTANEMSEGNVCMLKGSTAARYPAVVGAGGERAAGGGGPGRADQSSLASGGGLEIEPAAHMGALATQMQRWKMDVSHVRLDAEVASA